MIVAALILASGQALFPSPYIVIGKPGESCATAFNEKNESATEHWIAGFISGVNSARGGKVGRGTDMSGVIAEVKLDCQREPSRPLVWAAQETYKRLSLRGDL